jgi:circadian clock protein KaiC
VEKKKASVILIDSLNGYINSMPNERFLVLQMYELLTYLSDHGVLTLMVLAQHGLMGNNLKAPVDVSYMADTVVLLRQFEALGTVKKAISIIKKRTGAHDATIREFGVTSQGVRVGAALEDFHGVLTGTPVFTPGNGMNSHGTAG